MVASKQALFSHLHLLAYISKQVRIVGVSCAFCGVVVGFQATDVFAGWTDP